MSIRTEIPLTFPEASPDDVADVTFFTVHPDWFAGVASTSERSGGANEWYAYERCADGSDFLRWSGLFEFLVSPDGRFVACALLDGASVESFETYLLGHALSFALLKRGVEPMHATSVIVDGRAVAFLGSSGCGKSTLAAAFLAAGHEMLTDDLLIIRDVGGILCGFPGPPRVKLFPEIARQLLASKIGGSRMNPFTEKLVIPLEKNRMGTEPVPLHGFFAVHESSRETIDVSLQTCSTRESFLKLLEGTFNARVREISRLHQQFLAVQDWSVRLPVKRIEYRKDLLLLDDVRRAIVADVRTGYRQA